MITPFDNKSGQQHPDSKSAPVDDAKALPPLPPPAYSSLTFAPAEQTLPLAPVVNFLYIVEQHRTVNGRWTVDPNRPTPAAAMPVVRKRQIPDNLHLYSKHKPVSAELVLAGDVPCRSRLFAESKHHAVTLSILSRGSQRFHLVASSKHGSVTVYLPPDFEGPITINAKHRRPTVSKGVQERMTPISGKKGRSTVFVGRWEVYTEQNGAGSDGWKGDEVILNSKHGRINIAYVGEEVIHEIGVLTAAFRALIGGTSA